MIKFKIIAFLISCVSLSTCQFLVAQVNADKRKVTEVLYNGIELPEEWPPQNQDPKNEGKMKVPYLENPPKSIPIHIGRQLFVDDFLIEKTNLQRTYHQAEKHTQNPVFKPETNQEINADNTFKSVVYLGHGGVFYDPEDKIYKMYYTAGWRGGLALATSKDLINWERPKVNIFGTNIILPQGPLFAGGDNAVWFDPNPIREDHRYTLLTERLVDGTWLENFKSRAESPTHTLHFSPDGLNWSQGLSTGRAADYCSFFYNPFRGVWSFSIKRNTTRGRARFYYESSEFLEGRYWDEAVFWTNADTLDLPDQNIGDMAQLYSLSAVAYESIMVGQFYIHLGPNNKISEEQLIPKITELKLGFSRDGFHWHRPDRRPFIAASRTENSWDRAYLHGTNGVMLVNKDEIWFPYTGYSGIDSLGNKGMYTGASIGMAKLRRDGFASMETTKKNGQLTTKPLTSEGDYLFVNVDCPKGALTVEILDGNNKVYPGFSKSECKPIGTNSTMVKVEWENNKLISSLGDAPKKIRFHLSNGKLYSFWITSDYNGKSHGYLGAGGADYNGNVDDKDQKTK